MPVATDVRGKRKLQVATPTKSKKNGRKSADGAAHGALCRLRWGGVPAHAAHAHGASASASAAFASGGPSSGVLPPLRPRRKQSINYAEMDRGEDSNGFEVAPKLPGKIEPQAVVKTKSGRVAKRPRPADEEMELALQQSVANAALQEKRRRLNLDDLWQRALARADGLHESEPQIPSKWRKEGPPRVLGAPAVGELPPDAGDVAAVVEEVVPETGGALLEGS